MHIGIVTLSPSILFLIGLGGSVWLALKFALIPRSETAATRARGEEVVQSSTRLRLLKAARTIAMSTTCAPAAVAIVYVAAQIRIEGNASDPVKLSAIIATRDFLERTLGQLTSVAASTWVIALLVLATIWLVARNSASRRRWVKAIEARRRAYEASLATESIESVMNSAQAADAERFRRLQQQSQQISAANRGRIQAVENMPVLRLPAGDGQIEASIQMLRETIAQFEQEAEELDRASGSPG